MFMEQQHRIAANIAFTITSLFVIGLYTIYFFMEDAIFIERLAFIAPIIYLVLLCKKVEIFEQFMSPVLVDHFEMMKMLTYIITCQAIISLVNDHWAWWIFSLVVGVVIYVLEFMVPMLADGE